MLDLRLKQSVRTHTCQRCGIHWDSTACHADHCASCRPIVEKARRSESHARSRARVREFNAKLTLSKDERGRDWPRDSESSEPSCSMVTVCDAYHNGRPMRSRSAVL